MKVMDFLNEVSDIGKSVNELQKEVGVQEDWLIWDTLVKRYDVIELTQILYNFAKDEDFKIVLKIGLKKVKEQVAKTEKFANKYGIVLPTKPPESVTATSNVEEITDKYIFKRVYRGIQGFMHMHADAYISCETPEIREFYKKMLIEEMDIYDKFFEYGKTKGWTEVAPRYRV